MPQKQNSPTVKVANRGPLVTIAPRWLVRSLTFVLKDYQSEKRTMPLVEELGIDLGTVNVLVYVRGRGIVLQEPSVVAQEIKTGTVLEVGEKALAMLGQAW